MNKHSWLYARFRTMSIPEILFRIRQQATFRFNKKKRGQKEKRKDIKYQNRFLAIPSTNDYQVPDKYHFCVFHNIIDYTNIQNWHYDFISGKQFPKVYSFNINIRNEEYGSAKVVWEYNRLQFLTYLAVKYNSTNDRSYLNQFQKIISSWIEGNPYLIGVNWYSNIEVNLRIITWFLCWQILDIDTLRKSNSYFNDFIENEWLPSIYQHCKYSYKFPSKHSSANNHLISEYAGLFVGASQWRFKESKEWIRFAKQGLEREIQLQHSANGINKEEAAEYIQFITDFFLIAYVVGENTQNSFSKRYKEKLHKIFDYIFNFLDCEGHFPQYGDEDDGRCFILSFEENFNNFKSLLTSGAVIFNDKRLKSKSNGFDLKNYFLFGEDGKFFFRGLDNEKIYHDSKLYKDEGHFILRKHNPEEEIYIHIDAAPLGFLSIAAHGHADALSFIMHINGKPVFIDSGTYTYHTDPEWRRYFMGTSAHNTLRINKTDQALIAGPTMWLNHYKSQVLVCETSREKDVITASCNGYTKFGIIHTREFHWNKLDNELNIIDTIHKNGNDQALIEIFFHIHPEIIVEQVKSDEIRILGERLCILSLDSKLQTTIIKGETFPEPLGWYSPSFLIKRPATTIKNYCESNHSVVFKNKIKII